MISETKLDNSFPEGQFLIEECSKPYRIDRNCHGAGIMLYVKADIPSKLLFIESLPMEGFYEEINLQKKNFFFYLGFLLQPFTNHATVGEGGGYAFNSSLPLPSASQTT